MRAPGYVYVLVDRKTPGVVRIGSTPGAPADVARLENLEVQDAAYFSDRTVAERFVQDRLEEFRKDGDPEQFAVPVSEAMAALSAAMERLVGTRECGVESEAVPVAIQAPPVKAKVKEERRAKQPPQSIGRQILWMTLFFTMVVGVVLFVVPTAIQILGGGQEPPPATSAIGEETEVAEPQLKKKAPAPKGVKPKRTVPAEEPAKAAVKTQPAGGAPLRSVVPSMEPQAARPAALAAISGEELREHFQLDRGKATAAFKDGVIRVSDVVTKVGKGDVSFRKIKCKFGGAVPPGLAVGSTVTVEGVVKGKGYWTGTIALEQCRVL